MIAFSEPNQIVKETIVLLGIIWKKSNYLPFSMGISRARPSTLTKLGRLHQQARACFWVRLTIKR